MIVQEIDLSSQALTYEFDTFAHRFAPLKKVNLLVGPNNSGKSRLLRSAIDGLVQRQFVLANVESTKYWEVLPKALELLDEEQFPSINCGRIRKLKSVLLENPLRTLSGTRNSIADTFITVLDQVSGESKNLSELKRLEPAISAGLRMKHPENIDTRIIYVPTIRGFKSPPDNPRFFAEKTNQDYFSHFNHGGFGVECGGDSYRSLRSHLLGDKPKRKLVAEFERFLSEQFFEGKSITLIPSEEGKQVFVTIGKEKEQPFTGVGDGIQHLITILFPIFVNKQPTFQVVEEPELFLHPGFQARLLDCYFRDELAHVQLLAASHSNHLLNITLDRESISVFRIRKILETEEDDQLPKFPVVYIDGDARELLTDLGVQRASVLLSNCVIFVEGPTDRRYFQKFLELFAASKSLRVPIVDLHYSFLEYGGANLASYNFLGGESKVDPLRLIGQDFILIIDTDASDWKTERRKRLSSILREKLITFDAIEVENLISVKVLKKVVADYENRAITEFDAVKWNDYKNQRLGTFIETILGQKVSRFTKTGHPYADNPKESSATAPLEGYTLKAKMSFCGKALSHMNSADDLSAEAMELASKLFEFIDACNPNVSFENAST